MSKALVPFDLSTDPQNSNVWILLVKGDKVDHTLNSKDVQLVQHALESLPIWIDMNSFEGYKRHLRRPFDQSFLDTDSGSRYTFHSTDKSALEALTKRICKSKYWDKRYTEVYPNGLTDQDYEMWTVTRHEEPYIPDYEPD